MRKVAMTYSHLSNNRGGWNKSGGEAKICQITKRGGWKIFMKSINVEGGFYFVEGEMIQIIREMTVY